MPGFPDFKKAVAPAPQPSYSVCIGVAESLVVKQCLVEQWEKKDDFGAELKTLLTDHNQEFNPRGIKRGSEATGASTSPRPAKKLCIPNEPMSLDEFESKFEDRLGLLHKVATK